MQVAFETNEFGLGKFSLNYEDKQTYHAIYTIDNKQHKTVLPQPKSTGFTITIDNYTNEKYTYINLKTNSKTLENTKNKTFISLSIRTQKFQ